MKLQKTQTQKTERTRLTNKRSPNLEPLPKSFCQTEALGLTLAVSNEAITRTNPLHETYSIENENAHEIRTDGLVAL